MLKKLTLTAVLVAVVASAASASFAAPKKAPAPKKIPEPIYFTLATGEL